MGYIKHLLSKKEDLHVDPNTHIKKKKRLGSLYPPLLCRVETDGSLGLPGHQASSMSSEDCQGKDRVIE